MSSHRDAPESPRHKQKKHPSLLLARVRRRSGIPHAARCAHDALAKASHVSWSGVKFYPTMKKVASHPRRGEQSTTTRKGNERKTKKHTTAHCLRSARPRRVGSRSSSRSSTQIEGLTSSGRRSSPRHVVTQTTTQPSRLRQG